MVHPNEELLQRGYEAFGKRDIPAVLALFAEDIKWHISGRSAISGDYEGHEAVVGFFQKLMGLSGGTFQIEIHDLIASDDHGVVLTRESADRGGTSMSEDGIHVWHVKNGKLTEFWGVAVDQHASDEFWA